ncbi:metallophosphatase family protein [Thermococcus sp. GR7]|uniref:metallophosphoesterase family protein n=1 Tax=unclassified Thermococcus TaxID=2627626 RepID=UPI001430DCDA|nr:MULTISPECIES: metallophosphatase family protein [unclassified Thermococcus]NJE47062.1 metallophosphatase family protein [Thermococcus sp. GR7]NJE78113.1 metallophosphatase family protein [Thermococcus sp. GR4]NJF22770.1 metallophosphatase family protein [Thermococcus sp. GR5]
MVYVAVLANINGNLPALAKALERIEELKEEGYKIEKYYILGNIIGLFPYPREVLDTLDDLIKKDTVKVIRGEFDQIIAASDPHAEGPDYINRLDIPMHIKVALKHTWKVLDHEGREFIRDLPVYLVDRIGKNDVFGVYGSPLNPFEGVVLPDQPTSYYESIMRPVKDYEILLVASPRYPVNAMTRYGRVICPGSVGFPPGREHKATFALVDVDTLHTKFIEVDYDKKLVEERIKREGLPEELIRILYHGKI